ncbi:MAG TPA: sugar kinase [Alphaproteobacteria bacterium]|nr:sugar kinase [Alphaproteobacteria bacterium]MDP6270798.1 sugar kinase [Alphaproteobacteria bacterium]MDP7163853.1 sugar kinase [Alphaproteobacteria bacterium]MDP7428484.1 sugar kinase [Alphaproteobacteria bacterium]HJM52095.1 sugar kinase [Alphaproteobacteria bacterium]
MKVAAIGECMIEISGPAGRARIGFGGDTLNTAVYLARAGVSVDYLTALGDDPFSDEMLRAWQAEGVGIEGIVRRPGRLPGLYLIRTNEGGERSFYYWRDRAPARELFAGDGAAVLESLAAYDWVYLSGITLSVIGAAGCQALAGRLGELKAGGLRLAFDSNYRPRGWPEAAAARTEFDRLLPLVDIALPTLDDEQALYGDGDGAACAARHRAAGVAEVVVKMGADGCLVAAEGGTTTIPVPETLAPVDTTGAGDSFNAAYLAARLAGRAPAAAAAAGHQLAARVIGCHGAILPKESRE